MSLCYSGNISYVDLRHREKLGPVINNLHVMSLLFHNTWAQLFKTNDVVSKRFVSKRFVSKRFVKISNINITNTLLFFVEKM